ncbi:MAG: hypothetical protein O7G84_13260 [Gammaproteobacteria bacterium]|jgi:hypothetical protein|nr:hypothetical protein [Gammaproteobacteria bacterium]
MTAPLSETARELWDYMSLLCEEAYNVSWIQHLEYALWYAVSNGPMQYGRLAITEHHIAHLKHLSDLCDGWIAFEEEWVSTAEWERLYRGNIDHPRIG